jgi:hypothetical protein
MPPQQHPVIVMSSRSIGVSAMTVMVEDRLLGAFGVKADDFKGEHPRAVQHAIAEAFGKVLPLGYTWYASREDAPPVAGLQGQPHDAGLIIHNGLSGASETAGHVPVKFSSGLADGVADSAAVLAYLTVTGD